MATGKILERLRKLLGDSKYCPANLSAYIVTSADAHNSEYTADFDKRREYLSQFTGSAGTCVVTHDKALLWTDGRYFLQASKELDENWILMKAFTADVPTVEEWLSENLPDGSYVGTDPLLISHKQWKKISSFLSKNNMKLVAVEQNLVDIVWKEDGKKDMPFSHIFVHPIEYCGISWEDKIKQVREKMSDVHADYLLLSSLDSISLVYAEKNQYIGLFNLRGNDIMNNPVFKAYAIVSAISYDIELFLHAEKISNDVIRHLTSTNSSFKVHIKQYDSMRSAISLLVNTNHKIWINNQCPAAFSLNFKKDNLIINECPVLVMKSIKNDIEQQGIRQACIRDSAALCQYFGFLEEEIHKHTLNEVSAAEQLEQFRRQMDKFVEPSFPTISSSGPNCAIIHYSAANAPKPAPLDPNSIYLCDSGGQYWDGTTDITRTVHYGKPTDKEILAFTMVLKGHICLAKMIFPEGIPGHSLDAVARQPLWSQGLDYNHGTGHGIGCFLNVHEGPQCISLRATEDYGLKDGMLLSNEPGYYEDGMFGIRIENMMFAKIKKDVPNSFNGKKYMTFETVSLVPIQKCLIDPTLLDKEEIKWLNNYHQECLEKISPLLEKMNMVQGLKWLQKNTLPLEN